MRTNKNGVNKDQKDKVKKDGYNRGQHSVYCLTYHMIFVTHYRKPVINDEMSAAMKEFSNHMAEQFRGKVLSAETDRDHIHLLVSLPPNINFFVFVSTFKTDTDNSADLQNWVSNVWQGGEGAFSGTDQTIYLWGRYLILEPQLLYRNYRKCFS